MKFFASGLSPWQSEREHLHGVAHAAGTKLFDASVGAIFHRERFADALLVLKCLSLTLQIMQRCAKIILKGCLNRSELQ